MIPSSFALRDGRVFLYHFPSLRTGLLLSYVPFSFAPRRRFAVARPSYCGHAVARRAKAAFGLPTSPNCPQSFIEGYGYVGQDGGHARTDFLTDCLGLTYNRTSTQSYY
jgi:hypothetical protein